MSELKSKLFDVASHTVLASSLLYGLELGIFDALSVQSYTTEQLSTLLNIDERYTEEWCLHMRANKIITYNSDNNQYSLSNDQISVLQDETSPLYSMGAVQFAHGCSLLHSKLLDRFRVKHNKQSNEQQQLHNGIDYNDLNPHVTDGLRRWFTVGYRHSLAQYWLPSLSTDVLDRLKRTNANIADVGCGHGTATVVLATYFNIANVYGYDYDPVSLKHARELSKQSNLNNIQFVQYGGNEFKLDNNNKYDAIFFFASFHDMSNPQSVVQHLRNVLADDGAVILIEPYAGDTLEQTCSHPAGAMFAGISLHYCVSCAKSYSQDGQVMGAVQPNSVYQQLFIDSGQFKTLRLCKPQNMPNNRMFEVR